MRVHVRMCTRKEDEPGNDQWGAAWLLQTNPDTGDSVPLLGARSRLPTSDRNGAAQPGA